VLLVFRLGQLPLNQKHIWNSKFGLFRKRAGVGSKRKKEKKKEKKKGKNGTHQNLSRPGPLVEAVGGRWLGENDFFSLRGRDRLAVLLLALVKPALGRPRTLANPAKLLRKKNEGKTDCVREGADVPGRGEGPHREVAVEAHHLVAAVIAVDEH